MKKLHLLVLLLITFAASCQTPDSPLYLAPSPNDTIYIQLPPVIVHDTITITTPPVIVHDTIIETEIVEIVQKPLTIFKDTIIDVRWLATGKDTLDNWVIYGVSQYGSALRINIPDTTGFHSNKIIAGTKIPLSIKFEAHAYGDSIYTLQSGTTLNRLPFLKHAYKIREMDSTGALTQIYMNKDCEYSWQEGDTPQTMGAYTDFAYQAGHPHPNSWRHTHSFTTKYWRIRVRDKETGEIYIFPLTGNLYI